MEKQKFKQTEIGEIPEDWEVKTLGNLGRTIIGLTYSPDDVASDGRLVHRSSNIQNNRLSYHDNVYVIKKIKEDILLKENDILICVRNGSRDLIGKSALIKGKAIGETFGAFMSVFRASQGQEFIFHLILSNLIQQQINQSLGATINQITNKTLNDFIIPFPSEEEEQTAIATVLSDTDELITSLDKLIAKKKAIKQGAMQELLTGKKRLAGFEKQKGFKQTEIGEIPVDWKILRLGDLCELTSSKRIFENEYIPTGIPFYRGKEISLLIENKKLDDEYFIPESRYNEIKRQFGIPEKYDILITAVGTLGNTYLIPDDKRFYFKDGNLIWLRKIRDIDPKYLSIQIDNHKKYIINNAIGSSQKALTIVIVKKQQIPLPSTKEEQTAIATVLSEMDSELESLEKKRDKYLMIKQGMMQQLLTGKIRLI